MKTKKILLCALCAFAFTACSDDDDKSTPERPDIPTPETHITEGAFVVNQGSMYSGIPGGLTYINYQRGEAEQNVFQKVNGFVIGDTPFGALVYGDKLYIAAQESSVIQVVDRRNLKSIKTIKPENGQGSQPKCFAYKEGKVYVSMYDGHVARIDTVSLTIEKSVKVGPNPEEIAIAGNYLYSADSDGMNYQTGYGKTVSKINLTNFEVEKTIEVGTNPKYLASNGKDVFVICMGNYTTIPAMLKQIKNDDSVEYLYDATLMTINEDKLYTINAPYAEPAKKEYYVYSISDQTKSPMIGEGVESPVAIGVDPVSKKIFIGSVYSSLGSMAYVSDGYINEYDENGIFVKKYDAGVSPVYFAFNVTEAK